MSSVVISFLGSILHEVVLMEFIRAIEVHKRFRRCDYFLFVVIAAVVETVTKLSMGTSIIKFVVFFLSHVLLVCFILHLSLRRSAYAVTVMFVVTSLGDAVYVVFAIFGLEIQYETLQFELPYVLVGNLFIAALSFVVISVFRSRSRPKQLEEPIERKSNPLFVVYSLVVCLLIVTNFTYLVLRDISVRQLLAFNFLSMVCFIVSSMIFLIYRHKFEEKIYENAELKMQLHIINELSHELRRFKHNYLNMLHGMAGYIDNERWIELKQYFREIVDESQQITSSSVLALQNIKSYALFGVLTAKIKEAASLGVVVRLEVNAKVDNLHIKDTELCEVVGAFLDNAIEAAETCQDRTVAVEFTEDNMCVTMSIANRYCGDIVPTSVFNSKGYSTKGEGRGLGLWFVKKILDRYPNILWNTYIEKEMFIQELTYPK